MISSGLPANRKVSVAWQIVFTFIPIVNFWAFYRITKLRKYVLYIVVPSAIVPIILAYYTVTGVWLERSNMQDGLAFGNNELMNRAVLQLYIASLGLQALAIYLVIIWSRQHNILTKVLNLNHHNDGGPKRLSRSTSQGKSRLNIRDFTGQLRP